jgi:GT2 family glycosyltransferase
MLTPDSTIPEQLPRCLPPFALPVDLSVLIINWNSRDLLREALRSLRERTSGITYEVIVVDNGSRRESPQDIPVEHPWITYIASDRNLGFSGANNLAATKASGRYLLLLNADTVQTENALGTAVRYMDEHPALGAVGIQHLNSDGTHQVSAHAFPCFCDDILGFLAWTKPEVPPVLVEEKEVDWVCGSFLMVRRECWEQTGGLDETYFIYDEDIDWARRAQSLGWKIGFWPGASMIHIGSASGRKMRDKTYSNLRSRLTYYTRHSGRCAGLLFYTVILAKLFWGLLLAIIKGDFIGLRPRCLRWWRFATLASSAEGV